MYRAVTRSALRLGIDVGDQDALTALAIGMSMRLDRGPGGEDRLWVNGEDVSEDLRTEEIERNVSAVSIVPGVRRALVAQQRSIAEEGPIVMAGRDIGTVVMRDARVKVFLTAPVEERARRRYLQAQAGSLDGVQDDLARRDSMDSHRGLAPLRPAEDAAIIDTAGVDVEEIARRIAAMARPA